MHVLGLATSVFLLTVNAARPQSPGTQADIRTNAAATVRLTGRVVDGQGTVLADAAIGWADCREMSTATLLAQPLVRTGADGGFTIEVRPPGRRDTIQPRLLVGAKGKAAIAIRPGFKLASDEAVAAWVDPEGDTEPPEPRYAAETTVGDLVLADGARLFGRVRDLDGKPLAEVLVIARDVLQQGSRRQPDAFSFHCVARTDDRGIFELPCALPQGVELEFSRDGHYSERLGPVAAGSPLEVTMARSGAIAGRVLDTAGKAVAGAGVSIGYERHAFPQTLTTGADGAFRFTLAQRGRWRVQVDKRERHRNTTAASPVFEQPRENLEIVLRPKAGDPAGRERLVVRAIDQRSGAPVAEFRATAIWNQYANGNGSYRDHMLRQGLRRAAVAADGKVEVAGPDESDARVGCVRVIAAGFAPQTVTEVEWQEADAGKPRAPLTVELQPEATVQGQVRDDRTGEPVAGARVWARPPASPNEGAYEQHPGDWPADAITTAADGSFTLPALGEGEWLVRARHPERPPAIDESITLAAAEAKSGLVVKIPGGGKVSGRIVGMAIPTGSKVFLHPLPRQTFGVQQQYWFGGSGVEPLAKAIPIGADGAFSWSGVELDNHLLVLLLPARPRCGNPLYVPLEPFRVRRQGIQRDFDASDDRPGTITGKVAFPEGAVPFERLLVVADTVSEGQQVYHDPWGDPVAGNRSFVAADGTFAIAVGPGTYRLNLHEIGSNLRLLGDRTLLRVRAAETVTQALAARLVTVKVTLEPDADVKTMADVDRLELRVVAKDQDAGMIRFGDNDQYDFGVGVPVPPGCRELELLLPPASITLLARNHVGAIRTDDQRWQVSPVGRGEIDLSASKEPRAECTIKVGAPPEIPEPEAKKPDGEPTDTKKDG